MGRRTVLLIVAALIAALGTLLVFLYVRAPTTAPGSAGPGPVLRAVGPDQPGRDRRPAQAAGKIESGSVPREQVLPAR